MPDRTPDAIEELQAAVLARNVFRVTMIGTVLFLGASLSIMLQ